MNDIYGSDDEGDGNRRPKNLSSRGGRGNRGGRKPVEYEKKKQQVNVTFSLYVESKSETGELVWNIPSSDLFKHFKPIHLANMSCPDAPVTKYAIMIKNDLYWIEMSTDSRFWSFYKEGSVEKQRLHYYVLPPHSIEIK